MKKVLSNDFVYQLVALVLALIVVHLVYVTVIRPNADAILGAQADRVAQGEAFVPDRSLYVVLRDYEQESCFVLMLWAMSIMGMKTRNSFRERRMLEERFINVSEGMSILPEDARLYSRPLQALPDATRRTLLPRALLAALQRFAATQHVQDVSDTVRSVCEAESDHLDSELAMIRYIAWAIPSIGFIGTVRGIGDALGQAYRAVEGDIAGVTTSLGVAFNSTFVALVISIVIMFLMHQVQLVQERLVLDTQHYCEEHLIRHLQARDAL
ncbi:MAG: MotA/TolQ/ExbB proton channel family protein [Gammaproteobacteria bacterium]|nr:MotA/TolQ/ExbB proton channel family protein [Gammaproteobacteria bacterium]MYB37968.1 MotA/TolQ/ExbB proton channel family protein [Gammaproteobacteria bacterium]